MAYYKKNKFPVDKSTSTTDLHNIHSKQRWYHKLRFSSKSNTEPNSSGSTNNATIPIVFPAVEVITSTKEQRPSAWQRFVSFFRCCYSADGGDDCLDEPKFAPSRTIRVSDEGENQLDPIKDDLSPVFKFPLDESFVLPVGLSVDDLRLYNMLLQSSKQIGSSSSTRTATNQKSHDLFANTSVPQISDLDVDPTAPTDESKETADCTPSPIDVTDEWPSVEVSMSIPITSLDDDMIVVESVNAGAGTQESQISRVKELIQFWNLQQSTNF